MNGLSKSNVKTMQTPGNRLSVWNVSAGIFRSARTPCGNNHVESLHTPPQSQSGQRYPAIQLASNDAQRTEADCVIQFGCTVGKRLRGELLLQTARRVFGNRDVRGSERSQAINDPVEARLQRSATAW